MRLRLNKPLNTHFTKNIATHLDRRLGKRLLWRVRRWRARLPIHLSRSAVLRICLLFLGLVAFVAILVWLAPDRDSFSAFADRYFQRDSVPDALLFVLLTGLLGCVAVPRQVLAFAGGCVFGWGWGCLLVSLGCLLSCTFALHTARLLGRAAVERRFGLKAAKYNALLSHSPFRTAILLRLIPTGNNLAFSLLAGVSRIPALAFIAGSGVGYLPQNIVFSLLGSGVRVDMAWRTAGSAVLLVLSLVLAWRLYASWQRRVREEEGKSPL